MSTNRLPASQRGHVGAAGAAGPRPRGVCAVSPRAVFDAAMRESEFQASITDLCDVRHLPWLHVVDSRGQHADGWPDLFIADPAHGVAYAWELKRMRGRASVDQQAWLEALAECPRLESGLLRPDSWPMVERLLTKGERVE